MTQRLVVVGGDAAGMSAASQARRRRPPDDLEIVAFERSSWVSYSACGEPYHVAGLVDPLERLVARTPARFASDGIAVHTRHEVREIDLDRRTVTVSDLSAGGSRQVDFDHLMISTGATAVRPAIDGRDLPQVKELRTLDDAAVLRKVADARQGQIVIVGGGYIGLEAAEAFAIQGWHVTVVTSGPSVLEKTLDPELGDLVVSSMRQMGIAVVTGSRVSRIAGIDRVEGVETEIGLIPADWYCWDWGAGQRSSWPSKQESRSVSPERSPWTSDNAPRSTASGRQATVQKRHTVSPADRSTSTWEPSPTKRAE